MSKQKHLQGFSVIKVKFSNDSTSFHDVFMKEHSIRAQTADKPAGKTLFLINVPPWATEQSLQLAFSSISPVKSVQFARYVKQEAEDGFKKCYIVFENDSGVVKALKAKSLPPLSTDEEPIVLGLQKLIRDYNNDIFGQSNLEQHMIQIVKDYDKQEHKKKMQEKGMETDDEGWTVVTRKSRTPGVTRTEGLLDKVMEKKSKKEKVLKNFYRHQIRQAKKDQLAALRKKAEEDKKKILALKQRRAFKPF